MDLAAERQMRDAAMAWLRDREANGTTAFSRRDFFSYLGRDIRFMNPQTGIWKPAGWRGALSISTVYTPESSTRPYEDADIGLDGLGRYKWRGLDPDHADNRALRAAMDHHLPLIWFLGFAPGRYAAVYPVYLVKEEPSSHQFVVAVGVIDQLGFLDVVYPSADIEVAYTMRETKQRLHQAPFRAAVLDAYTCRCAVCRFGHADL
ncbi:MAG: hypothetical protein LBR27_09690, partial [Bifidobacteriaceae bacterium]|nr:hypothetical protein [Bifidobacteriaceae bacterium]